MNAVLPSPASRFRAGWGAAIVLLVLLGAWEVYVDAGGADPLILPAPHAVAKAMYTDRSLLWSNFLVTAREVLLGMALAAIAGLGFSIALHFSRTLRAAVYPLLIASQTIPIPMLAPVLVLWLGFGILPKLVVIALVSFFSIVVTTLGGLAAVDPGLIKLMRTFDASRGSTFRHVEFPSALPGLFTGAKIAVVVAVIGAVSRGAVRCQLRPRISVRAIDPTAADGARLRRRRGPVGVRDRVVRLADHGRAAAAAVSP